jgi:hypothetical protein
MLMLRRVLVVLAGWLVVAGLGLPAGALGAGDANQAACPNEALEGFREYLADCRGYEMVSPPFKDSWGTGGAARGASTTGGAASAVSVDGSRIVFNSLGVFAGAQDSLALNGGYYLFSRSGSGWATSAIGPSQASFPAQWFWTVSSDLGRSLWVVHSPSQSVNAADLYVREGDGSLVKVGPLVPPSASGGPPAGSHEEIPRAEGSEIVYAGASSDLSHVLFNTNDKSISWPGDTTVDRTPSLYEYVGVGNTRPALVGVDGEGRLISDCGTSLGSQGTIGLGSNDAYNAVSGGGGVVFFTSKGYQVFGGSEFPCVGGERAPEVSELYARLGGFETVAISEPSVGQCGACDTSVRMPAEFQGASLDGSKVFFLSEQGLLEGATGMNLYEYDFDAQGSKKVSRVSGGVVEPLVQGVARVSGDGSRVYFVAKGVLSEGANGEGREPVAGGENLYVFERDAAYPAGRVGFVGTLSEEDSGDWSTRDARPVQATPDGRFLVFNSVADLTAGDTSSKEQVFEYDAVTERLVRVSVGQAGYASGMANADAHSSFISSQFYNEGVASAAAASGLAVSADGSTVVFNSAAALTPGAEVAAAAHASSAYEYRSVGSIANGNVYLVSDGTSKLGGVVGGLDASAQDVFWSTGDQVLAGDGDLRPDTYDARVGGGFPVMAGSVGCVGEACQGAGSAGVSFGVPGSVGVAGGGNLSPPTGSVPVPVVAPKAKAPTRAQRLAGALRGCRHKAKAKRRVCEAQARKRFAGKANVNAKGKG